MTHSLHTTLFFCWKNTMTKVKKIETYKFFFEDFQTLVTRAPAAATELCFFRIHVVFKKGLSIVAVEVGGITVKLSFLYLIGYCKISSSGINALSYSLNRPCHTYIEIEHER